MSEVLRWVAVGVAIGVGADTLRRARTLTVGAAEQRLFRVLNNGPDAVHLPVWAVMQAGSLWAVFAVGAALRLRDEQTRTAVAVIVGTAVWAGVKRVKRFAGRGRPAAHLHDVHVRGQDQTGLGYPSGHSAVSLTLALIATQGLGAGVQVAGIGVALFTAGARMYVGAHLPLDVTGGLAIGVVVGEVASAGLSAWG